MRTVKTIIICAFAALLCSCGQKTGTAWISGEISDASSISFEVFPRGAEPYEISKVPVVDGKFLCELENVPGATEVVFDAGYSRLGASVVPGDTLSVVISLVDEARQSYACEFSGKTAEDSEVFCDMVSAYDDVLALFYFPETLDESLAILEENHAHFHSVNDARMNKFFKHLADVKYADMKSQVLLYKAEDEGTDIVDCEEYNNIISGVDPNDPAIVGSQLASKWLEAYCEKGENMSETGKLISMLNLASQKLDNPVVMKEFLSRTADKMFQDGVDADADNVKGFWSAFTAAAADFPELIEKNQAACDTRLALARGEDAKDFGIQTPDGKDLLLSSLFGKVLYIDIWATWCGPCRGEIPYLAKVAEHYKDSEDVYVMSISCDQDHEAWINMITADKPAWPQYFVTKENHKLLNEGWSLIYIPRFLIIDKEGKIFNAYAPRPSSEDVYAEIDACVAK